MSCFAIPPCFFSCIQCFVLDVVEYAAKDETSYVFIDICVCLLRRIQHFGSENYLRNDVTVYSYTVAEYCGCFILVSVWHVCNLLCQLLPCWFVYLCEVFGKDNAVQIDVICGSQVWWKVYFVFLNEPTPITCDFCKFTFCATPLTKMCDSVEYIPYWSIVCGEEGCVICVGNQFALAFSRYEYVCNVDVISNCFKQWLHGQYVQKRCEGSNLAAWIL